MAGHLTLAALLTGCAVAPTVAQTVDRPLPVAAPAPQETGTLPLYGSANPGSRLTEIWANFGPLGKGVRNVSYPTITPVRPAPGKANGTAVIVAPGGAFMMLAWEHEGLKVAQALADRGYTAFILRYWLNPTPLDEREARAFIRSRLAATRSPDGSTPRIAIPPSGRTAWPRSSWSARMPANGASIRPASARSAFRPAR
ncbi:hypothetical protein M9978_07410 [Sphingomonas sp. MG17]|uniref:Alpha/beta hydrolase family protein n=1 Tax=Sphingomonas tagetis TaxID=2949092 RepID=A0A9X2KK75_9SPHN|nr:hypothetical protein [Sphingomonas tagetis]MCP3730254.1 hypothetical protein [Sphingomonas tagetis]